MNRTDLTELHFEGNDSKTQRLLAEMNANTDMLAGRTKAYACYRFGLEDQPPHSRKEAAAFFSITEERAGTLETAVFRQMGIRFPGGRTGRRG